MAMSSGAPWLRGHKAAPSEEGGPGCAPAAPAQVGEASLTLRRPGSLSSASLTLRVPESLEPGGHRSGPDTQPPALL